jgi:hypothetical protein
MIERAKLDPKCRMAAPNPAGINPHTGEPYGARNPMNQIGPNGELRYMELRKRAEEAQARIVSRHLANEHELGRQKPPRVIQRPRSSPGTGGRPSARAARRAHAPPDGESDLDGESEGARRAGRFTRPCGGRR